MEVKWIVFLAFAGLAVSYVAGNRCSTEKVFSCYNNLIHYEGLGFPLYGEDEQALDETCTSMNEAFDCLDEYLRSCGGQEDCDEKCVEIINDIGQFIVNTGLKNLQNELCDPLSPLRLTYLENYVCLEDNAEHYAKCQNTSQLSQLHMSTITEREEAIYARCCFFSWYESCFTNITRDSCNENATLYVNLSLHLLMNHIVLQICEGSNVTCSTPPLPSDEKTVLTHDDGDNCLGDGCSLNSTEPSHDQHDEDNCVEENCLSSSCAFKNSVSNLFIHCAVLLFSSIWF